MIREPNADVWYNLAHVEQKDRTIHSSARHSIMTPQRDKRRPDAKPSEAQLANIVTERWDEGCK